MNLNLRKKISNSFNLSGLTLCKEACDFLTETLMEFDDTEREEWMDRIIDFILHQSLKSPMVEKNHVELAILDNCKMEVSEEEDIFQVISAFDIPRFHYCPERKKFMVVPEKETFDLFDVADWKGKMLKERFDIIHQLTARNSVFTQDGVDYKLRSVDFLLSSHNLENVVVLGLLTSLKEGQHYIEDPSGYVPLNLSNTNFYDGLFTDGCFILVEGSFDDGVLIANAVGLPPRENSDLSRSYFSVPNCFGGDTKMSIKNNHRLNTVEQRRQNTMIVFMSDIFLDQPLVLKCLEKVFHGFSNDPPYLFVLMGNFLSSNKGFEHFMSLKEGFKSLGDMISQFPDIVRKSRFVIVPGGGDTASARVFPFPPLSKDIVSGLTNVCSKVILTTNPCRIVYCTQEMVLIREDLVTKLCRNTISFPQTSDVGWHFARTIICQYSLVPVTLNVCPTYWSSSAALNLYPSPDIVVVGDRQHPFKNTYNNCIVFNPGSFSLSDFAFKVYYPASRTVEDCQVSATEDV